MKTHSRPMRVIATLLAFALVHGAVAPQAWAQVVSIGAVNAPVGGTAAAAAGNAASPMSASAPSLSFSNAGLTGSLSAASFAPAPVQTPVAAAVSFNAPAAAAPAAFSAQARAVPAALTPAGTSIAASKESAPNAGPASAAAKAAAPEAGPVTLQAGPRTGRIASKAAAIISGVRAFFGGKSVENVPAAKEAVAIAGANLSAPHASELEPSTADSARLRSDVQSEPPAPAQPTEPGKKGKGKGWFGLGAAVAALIGGML
ncbi:MAG: hypothetical protein NUW21_05990, partial [Elusimicrobia bacterium]|nr:hypothetical protein [Elusimicrobiota bacterium]